MLATFHRAWYARLSQHNRRERVWHLSMCTGFSATGLFFHRDDLQNGQWTRIVPTIARSAAGLETVRALCGLLHLRPEPNGFYVTTHCSKFAYSRHFSLALWLS